VPRFGSSQRAVMILAFTSSSRPTCLISLRSGGSGLQRRQSGPLHTTHDRQIAPSSGRGLTRCRTASGAASIPAPEEPEAQQPASTGAASPAAQPPASPAAQPEPEPQAPSGGLAGWFKAQQQKGKEGKGKLAALGLAAVLAYGLFDGISYTIAFSIAFLGYEARTGLNPTQNVADLVKICVLMW
jgi:hypothetical protein